VDAPGSDSVGLDLLTGTRRQPAARVYGPASQPPTTRLARRPTGFDTGRYKKRNVVERAINRLKNFRPVVIRYDKRANIFLGTVTLAALIVWLRS
jgi:transposase